MARQKGMPGTAKVKRNCWHRGNGAYSMRGELKRGIALNKKRLNRKVRHQLRGSLQNSDYKKVCRTLHMEDFT
ncbi:hypothetical protein [Robinsoniella peoriensis]|uniref:hypothetical protein n=1 Tax=Robinsoniella peoriensis TaxID=180332 RepID=UPI0037536607